MDSNIEVTDLIVFPFNFFLFVIDITLDFTYSGMIGVAYFRKFTYKNLKFIGISLTVVRKTV